MGNRLDLFAEWASERGLASPSEVTLGILEQYQRFLFLHRKADGEPLSIATQLQRLVVLRGFFRFLVRERYLGANPAADLVLPRDSRRLPRDVLSAEEVERLLAVPDCSQPLGLRDRTILELFYATGVRRSELVRLCLYDVDFSRGTVFVREGKGRKDRVVPAGERTLAWLTKYLREVRPRLACGRDRGELFLNETGAALSADRVGAMVRRCLEHAGLHKRGSCHLLRHTMATLMLEGGADVRYVQEMLGHSNLETTAIYTRVTIAKLKQVHDATHPGARLLRRADGEAGEAGNVERLGDELLDGET
jgi:integrase/recombinase XerD